jgi:diacylglycerol kinase (ATP)
MKGLFIINPASGSKRIQRGIPLMMVDKLLSDPDSKGLEIVYTHKKGDALELARSLTPGSFDYVCAVGGDGTVGEAAAGLYQSGSGIPLAIIAAGTANDFSSSLGLPKTYDGLTRMISGMRTVKMDMGLFNGKYFYSEAAGGGLGEVAHTTDPELKSRFGYLAYLGNGFKKYGSLKLETVPLIYEIDGVEEEFDTFCFTLTNTKRIGGINKVAPDAKINDGLMDLCIIKRTEPIEVLPLLAQCNAGTHVKNTKAIEYRQVRTLKVRVNEEGRSFPLDIDGEEGGVLPLEFEVIPGAIDLIVPEGNKTLNGNLTAD